MAFVSGAFIALAAFTLLLWAVAAFMPIFLRFTSESRWAPLLPALSFLFLSLSGLLRLRIRRPVRHASEHRF